MNEQIFREKQISQIDQAEQSDLNERNTSIDFVRVLAMLFVIAIHTRPFPMKDNRLFRAFFDTFLYMCNSCFFMISGYLNLSKTFLSSRDWEVFYKKRIITVVLPFVMVLLAVAVLDMRSEGQHVTFLALYNALMNGYSSSHFWFMYSLIGMLLSTPLLSKALHAMDRCELNLMIGLCLGWNVVSIFLTVDLGIGFAYTGWILSGWIISFVAGYYCHIGIDLDNKRKWYLLGVLCYFATCICIYLFQDHFQMKHDIAPTFVVFTMGAYVFLIKEIKIQSGWMKKVIRTLAKHSFTIYLIHFQINKSITPKLLFFMTSHNTIMYIEKIGITFIVSFMIAMLLDTFVFIPIQRLCLRRI